MPVDRPAILRNAEKLLRSGKLDQAIAEYLRIVEDQPADWNTANVLGDLYVRAAQTDRAIEQFVRIADHLHAEGFLPKAAAVYKKVLKLKPDHEHAMLQAGEIAGRQGLVADARVLFNTITTRRRARGDERGVAEIAVRLAGLDPNDFEARLSGARTRVSLDDVPGAIADLKALAAYMQEKDRPEEALRALREAAALDPDDADLRARPAPPDAVSTASEVLTANAEAVDPRELLGTDQAQLRSGNRAESLEALARLLGADAERRDDEVSPGGSIAESESAAGFEGVGLGEDDPDEVIPQQLSGQTPLATRDGKASPVAVQAVALAAAAPASDDRPADLELPIAAPPQPPAFVQESVVEQVTAVPAGRGRTGEVDLSVALDEIRRPSAPPEAAASPKAVRATETGFVNPPDENYQLGLSLYEAGRLDEAMAPLQAASRSPKARFLAASLVGRIYRDRGEVAEAVEWLERAAQAPAPTPDEGHRLLFDLADALERAGETARALATCMELQADAGNYRDVAARIDRLAKVRARG